VCSSDLQGVLFGKNTTAGLFNVTTASPTRSLEARLAARAGGLGENRLEAAVGGPLGHYGDVAQVRIAGMVENWPDDIENTKRGTDGPDVRQRAARLKLAVEPLSNLDVMLIGETAATDGHDLLEQAYRLPASDVQFLRRFDPRFDDDGFDHRTSQNYPTRLDRDTHRGQMNVRYSPSDVGPLREPDVVLILGYTRLDLDVPRDFDLTPADLLQEPRFLADYDQRSAELRFTATTDAPLLPGTIELLGGFFAFESHLVTDAIVLAGNDLDDWLLSEPGIAFLTGRQASGVGITLPSTPNALEGDGLRIFSDQKTSSQALFADASWLPSERWKVSAGARLTFERKTALLRDECFRTGVVCLAGGAEAFSRDLRRRDTDVSPRFAVQYFPADDLSLFATRSSGFKSGGFNNQSTTPRALEVDPERAASWEAGAKGRLFDGTLSYSATFFHMTVDDLQLQDLVDTLVTVRNAASARSRGVEAEFDWLTPWRPLSIRGAAAFTDARFESFPNAVAPVGAGSERQDLSGRRLPFVPEWHVEATPNLTLPVEIAKRPLDLTLALDVLFQTNQYLDTDLDPNTRQDAYTLVNGRIGVSTTDGSASLTLRVTNLTNADVAYLIADLPIFFPGGYFTSQEFQRNWSLEAAIRF